MTAMRDQRHSDRRNRYDCKEVAEAEVTFPHSRELAIMENHLKPPLGPIHQFGTHKSLGAILAAPVDPLWAARQVAINHPVSLY